MVERVMHMTAKESLMVKNWIEKLMPIHGFVMLLITFGIGSLSYFGTRFFTQNRAHHILETEIDKQIPLCTFFVLFYVLAYIQWFVGYFMIAKEKRAFCDRYLIADMIAKTLCLICYMIYPTSIHRPEITESGIWDQLTKLIYKMDSPDNLFPSMHCMKSYLCVKAAMRLRKRKNNKLFVICHILMSFLVFASTIMIKQHVIIDIVGGIVVVEIGLFVSGIVMKEKMGKKWVRKR